jgi:tetratricopeptide (TPR) repeat protein
MRGRLAWLALIVCAALVAGDSLADALAARQFGSALRIVDSMLKTNPGDLRLWTARGIALDGLGRHKEGLASFDRALKLQPSFLPALKAASEAAYRWRDTRAGSYLNRLLRVEPASEPAHAMIAVLAFEAGDCTRAVSHFERSLNQTRGNDIAASQYGHCLLQTGRAEEAVQLFAELVAGVPANMSLGYNLAVAQLQHNQPEAAISTLTARGADLDAGALNLLAAAQAASGRTAEAVTTLRRAIQSNPADERNYLDLAALCQRDGALSLAIDFLNEGLSRVPASGRLYASRGVVYAHMGETEKAELDFERAASLEPEEAYAAAGLSVLFSETGRAEGAAKLLRQKLDRSPDDPVLSSLFADALIRDGAQPGQPEFEESRQALLRAIRVRPRMARAHAALGKLYLREGNTAAAVQALTKALEIDPANRPALSQLVAALRKAGRNRESAEAAERLRRQYEKDLELETARQRVRIASEGAAPLAR